MPDIKPIWRRREVKQLSVFYSSILLHIIIYKSRRQIVFSCNCKCM